MEKSAKNKQPSFYDYPAHWLGEIIDRIEKRNVDVVNLATGKTPSGHIHLGIIRELLICDAIRRIFVIKNKEVKFRLFIDNLDAAKRFPGDIPIDHQNKYLGYPFVLMPDPFGNSDNSYDKIFGNELISTFDQLGIQTEIIWTDDLYKTDEMKEMIRIGLNKNDLVKKIVAKYLTASMDEEKKLIYYKIITGSFVKNDYNKNH